MVTDEAGNVYVAGTGVGPMGSKDFVTLKYDASGALLWEAYYALSPPVAEFIRERRWLRVLVRTLLLPLVGAVSLVV